MTHPAFDRPPVVNARRPGRPAGTLSLAGARRRRKDQARQAGREAEAAANAAAANTVRVNAATAAFGRASFDAACGEDAALPPPVAGSAKLDARGLDAPERAVIEAALSILRRSLRQPGAVFDSPERTREFMRLHLAGWDRERFAVLFLDGQHQLIELEMMFEGTLTQASVYPLEVVRRALHWNAGAVILAHNQPSGNAEPSRADEYLTAALRSALALVDVRVLDHLVIGWPGVVSFAERGLL